MASVRDSNVDALIHEVRELRRDIKELRMLLVFGLLRSEEQRSRDRFNDTLLAFAKSVLTEAAERLTEVDRETSSRVSRSLGHLRRRRGKMSESP